MNDPPTALVGFGLFAQPLNVGGIWTCRTVSAVGLARVVCLRFDHTSLNDNRLGLERPALTIDQNHLLKQHDRIRLGVYAIVR